MSDSPRTPESDRPFTPPSDVVFEQNMAMRVAQFLVYVKGFTSFSRHVFWKRVDDQHGIVVQLGAEEAYVKGADRRFRCSLMFGVARRDINDYVADWANPEGMAPYSYHSWRPTVSETGRGRMFPGLLDQFGELRASRNWYYVAEDSFEDTVVPEIEAGLEALEGVANLDQIDRWLVEGFGFFANPYTLLVSHALRGRREGVDAELERHRGIVERFTARMKAEGTPEGADFTRRIHAQVESELAAFLEQFPNGLPA